MIIDIPKHLLKPFRKAWKSSIQDLNIYDSDELIFTSEGYLLNERLYATKDPVTALPNDTTLVVTEDLLTPILPGALDLKAELFMLNTSIINDLSNKSYARQLYQLYNPTNKPLTLSFPELRFLWNYIRAYVAILIANEHNKDFDISQIKDQFLQGLSTISLAKPRKDIPDNKYEYFNNYQIWYDSSMFGTRWQDYV